MDDTLFQDPELLAPPSYPDLQDLPPEGVGEELMEVDVGNPSSSLKRNPDGSEESIFTENGKTFRQVKPSGGDWSAPTEIPTNSEQSPEGPSAPVGPVESRPLPPPGEQPSPAPAQPQAPRRTQQVPSDVLAAINAASQATGVPSTYLTNVARVESGFRTEVKASTSSATGLFQFIDQTWLAMVKRHGAERGLQAEAEAIQQDNRGRWFVADKAAASRILSLRSDASLNAFMGARYAQANAQVLQRDLGKAPGDTDLYMAHFLGARGAVRFLRGMQANENDTAANYVAPEAVSANRAIFFDKDGRARSLKEVYQRFASRLEGGEVVEGPARGNPTGREPIAFRDLSMPPDIRPGQSWSEASRAAIMLANGQERAGFMDAFREGFNENLTGRLISYATAPAFRPDPNFRLDPKVHMVGIPDQYLSRFSRVFSEEQASAVRQEVLRDMATKEKLADAGWTGTLGQVAGAFMDPSAIAVGIASGGIGTAAQSAFGIGRTGGRVIQGVAGAAGNLAVEGGLYALGGDTPTTSQLLISAGIGMAFGAAFGKLSTTPQLTEEAAALSVAGRSMAEELRTRQLLPNAPPMTGDEIMATAEAVASRNLLDGISQADAPQAKFGSARWSVAGQVGRSDIPSSRAVMSALGTDLVGKGTVQNAQAADQATMRLFQQNFHAWRSAVVAFYDDWAKARGYSWWARAPLKRQDWKEFNEQIAAYVRNEDPTVAAQFDESVRKAGDQFRTIMAEYADRLQKAGVAGADLLAENANYAPRIWSLSKINVALRDFGQENVERVVASAIMKSAKSLEDRIALKMAKATVDGAIRRGMEAEDRLSMLFRAAGDEARLTSILTDEFGLAAEDVKLALTALRSTEPAKDARLRFRMRLDESYTHTFPDGRTLALSDLLENSADELMGHYLRKMSARIALAETKVYSPVDGRLLVDGIKSDNHLESLIRQIQKDGMANPEQAKKDIENIRWAYDRILGRPDPAALGETAQWLRLLRNVNFARLMGQIGFAQLMDIGRAANSAGIKSFMQHIGGFKRIRDADGKFILKHGLDRELEAAFGTGGDRLRGFVALNLEDPGGMRNLDRGKFVDKANAAMDSVTYLVGEVSGMHYINQWLTLVTGRVAAQKFANLASKKTLSKADRNLISFLGLDDTMLDRVLNQVRTNFGQANGDLFGRKVARMNLDNWTDQEARAAFEFALYRFSRSAVQQNDIGAMAKVMSHPLAQTVLQFRSYALTAYENQLLQAAAHPLDNRQWAMAAGSTLSGALVYMAQVHLQAIGRSDAQQYVQDRLGDNTKLALSVFQRTGFSSIIPMVADSVASFTPMGPLFDARTTGQPTDFLFGNPSVGLVKDVASVSKALMTSTWNGLPMTQNQMRDIQRVLIMGNTMPILQIYNGLIADRPLR